MKTRTLFVSSVALAALPFIVDSVQASSNTVGTVNATYLNVRTGPSTNDSVIGALPNQSNVTILGESGNWYKIQYNNQEAYVSKDYVTVSSSKYKVTADALRVRSDASTSSSIIGMLSNGDEVTVESENNGWCKITYNNQAAYVSKAFLASSNSSTSTSSSVQSTSTFYVNADSLRFRKGPGTNYNIIDVLSSGQKVEVTGQSGNWYKVRYNGNDGYVSKDYLSTSQNVTTSSSTSTSQTSSILHWPASGGIVTSDFGPRWGSMHYGVDIAAPGNIQILAAASGTVSRSYYSTSYGNVVFLTHHINGQLYTTVYAHMKNRYVNEGDTVSQGQVLGYMGSTGEATGQHLHFELHKGEWNYAKSNAINPLRYLQH